MSEMPERIWAYPVGGRHHTGSWIDAATGVGTPYLRNPYGDDGVVVHRRSACGEIVEANDRIAALESKLAAAEAVIAQLPRTQDHKPLVPGMTVWFNDKDNDEPLPATVKDFFDWGGGEDDCWDDDEYDVAVVWAAFDSQCWRSMDATRAYSTPEAAKEARDAT